ncbi:MAG: hypothetical protein JKY60_11970 [Kordiimonadaceae bacterium]|nr:hypothetical protein [Kordiimonadaceae bacterium]
MFARFIRSARGQMSGVEFAIISVLVAGATAATYNELAAARVDKTTEIIADGLTLFHVGCGAYVRDPNNVANLLTQTAVAPVNITPAMLTARLPTGFNDQSAIGQQHMCTVKLTDGSLEYTSFNYGGGAVLGDTALSFGAFRIGNMGGAVTTRNPDDIVTTSRYSSQLRANFDGPAVPIPLSTLTVTSKFGVGGIVTDNLKRNVFPGLANANIMGTELGMGGNDIADASEFRASGVADGAGINAVKTSTLTNLDASSFSGTAAIAPIANTLVERDGDGRFQAALPLADSDVATMEFVLAQSGGSGPCGDAPSIGDVCSDGMVYVGRNALGGGLLYVDPTQILFQKPYPNGILPIGNFLAANPYMNDCRSQPELPHCSDGPGLTKILADVGVGANSFSFCLDLTAGGHSDWYVPTKTQMIQVVIAREAAGVVDYLSAPSPSVRYATSSVTNQGMEHIDLNVDGKLFSVAAEGHGSFTAASLSYYVKCIRLQ